MMEELAVDMYDPGLRACRHTQTMALCATGACVGCTQRRQARRDAVPEETRTAYGRAYYSKLLADPRRREARNAIKRAWYAATRPIDADYSRRRNLAAYHALDAAGKARRRVGHWGSSRRAAQKQRAIKRDAFVEDVSINALAARDGWICQICGKACAGGPSADRRWAASIDHIIPLSRNGAHCMDNCDLAHQSCNARKHNRLPSELPVGFYWPGRINRPGVYLTHGAEPVLIAPTVESVE